MFGRHRTFGGDPELILFSIALVFKHHLLSEWDRLISDVAARREEETVRVDPRVNVGAVIGIGGEPGFGERLPLAIDPDQGRIHFHVIGCHG